MAVTTNYPKWWFSYKYIILINSQSTLNFTSLCQWRLMSCTNMAPVSDHLALFGVVCVYGWTYKYNSLLEQLRSLLNQN